jgi:hypothetical protein
VELGLGDVNERARLADYSIDMLSDHRSEKTKQMLGDVQARFMTCPIDLPTCVMPTDLPDLSSNRKTHRIETHPKVGKKERSYFARSSWRKKKRNV